MSDFERHIRTDFSPENDRWTAKEIDGLLRFCKENFGISYCDKIGQGENSLIFSSELNSSERRVAIKYLIRRGLTAMNWFRRKALAMRQLGQCPHPNIIETYEYFTTTEQDNVALFLMEKVSTDSFEEVLPRVVGNDWRNLKLIDTFIQVCTALDWAHQHSVFHGDLKPSNIMFVSPRWEHAVQPRVKVSDFGIVLPRSSSGNHLIWYGDPFAHESYMSPEQRQDMPVDGRSDIYALGCIMFEAYMGRRLLAERDQQRALWPLGMGDPGFGPIVCRATMLDADSRYQRASEMRKDLEQLRKELIREEFFEATHRYDCVVVEANGRADRDEGNPIIEARANDSNARLCTSFSQRILGFASLTSMPKLFTLVIVMMCVLALLCVSLVPY